MYFQAFTSRVSNFQILSKQHLKPMIPNLLLSLYSIIQTKLNWLQVSFIQTNKESKCGQIFNHFHFLRINNIEVFFVNFRHLVWKCASIIWMDEAKATNGDGCASHVTHLMRDTTTRSCWCTEVNKTNPTVNTDQMMGPLIDWIIPRVKSKIINTVLCFMWKESRDSFHQYSTDQEGQETEMTRGLFRVFLLFCLLFEFMKLLKQWTVLNVFI